ncbi:MAG: NifB/NifX family molybdenum-iron cluster-binding protein [Candidatus Omnitrophica bacterium]|nr:NifB/NifX family molybdenum-iron cluster-binding protein [Candidatus Omnitrophota bacterium]
MKLAITSKGNNLESEVDPRFGRAAYLIIVDSETLEFMPLDNSEGRNALKGAGIQAATMINDYKAEVLLTGHCGPNAFKTCAAAGIKVVNNVSGTIQNAIKDFNEDKFTYADNADTKGHL